MKNPAIWLSIFGVIYAAYNNDNGDNTVWIVICLFIFAFSIAYNFYVKFRTEDEKEDEIQFILDRQEGYIARTIPCLNLFFNMFMHDTMFKTTLFYKGKDNEVLVKPYLADLTPEKIEQIVKTVKNIVQHFFDTNFELPENFVQASFNTIESFKTENFETQMELMVLLAKPEVRLRPRRYDVLMFHKAVFIVQFFKNGKIFTERTFHIKPNTTYRDAVPNSTRQPNAQTNN